MRLSSALRQHVAALRLLVVFTVLFGLAYPLAITAVAQVPGMKSRADGSLVSVHGAVVGSALLAQGFVDSHGTPLPAYLQSRPSAAGANGYDPTASGGTNLGPESVVDTLANPAVTGSSTTLSLLSQVCSRSLAVGQLDGVSGARPYCTAAGLGATLGVFWSGPGYAGHVTRVVSLNQECPAKPFVATYDGVQVTCATYGTDYASAQTVVLRGSAPAHPAVPADAVTASASGLDPDISPAYARLQEARIARARGISVADVAAVVARYTTGRALGFMGEPVVNVLRVNVALDQDYPVAH